MANTYTQLYIHYVFAVQSRRCLITKRWQEEIYKYLNGIINQQGHKLYLINGMADHVHLLISMSPKQSPSDLMYHLKRNSSLWINQNRFSPVKFSWQEGFGAFSVGRTQLPYLIRYIENQEEHHKTTTFLEEYHKILTEHEIDFDERYIFRSLDE